MTLKIIGAVCILCACGGFGFNVAASHRYQTKLLRQLLDVLDLLECELNYRLTPLPELCNTVSNGTTGVLRQLFFNLSNELNRQLSPNVERCVQTVLAKERNIPSLVEDILLQLGRSLGKYDLEGQLQGIESTRSECHRILQSYTQNQDARLRSYQTLGLCAGAALAILFI